MKPAKKIVMVVGTFPSVSETFIVNKFVGLLEQGVDVHIVCSSFERTHLINYPKLQPYLHHVHSTWPQKTISAMILIPVLFFISLFGAFARTVEFFKAGLSIQNLKRFYQDAVIILLKPDILHFEFGAMAIGREYLKELLKCKVIVSFRGYDLNFSGLEDPQYYHEVWKYADAIHCLGEDLWKRAQERGCPVDKPHYLIPPAIDVEFFKPTIEGATHQEERQAPIRILSIGRLEWKKGYEFALQAIKILKDQGMNIQYEIIGDGNYLEAIAFCRHQCGLEAEVDFLGKKSPTEIKNEMEHAHILIHPAISEGFCNAVLESQAMELPVVVSDAGGLPENVVNGVTGFVVPRRDPKAMADKIRFLAENRELRARMGRVGRERVMEKFQIDRQINCFKEMYQEVI